jgi:hypothetical protein
VRVFDFSAVEQRSDRAAVAELRRRSVADGLAPSESDDGKLLRHGIAWLVVVTVFLAIIAGAHLPFTGVSAIQLVFLYGFFGLIGVVALTSTVYGAYRLTVRWGQFFRAHEFAEANGLIYNVSEAAPRWNSLLFKIDMPDSGSTSVFTATGLPVFEAGNYHCVVGSEGRFRVQRWGYIVADLGADRPRAILRSNNRESRKRWGTQGAYRDYPIVSLGAAADRRFSLYCPSESADAVLEVFNATLVSQLSRLGRNIDAEIQGSFLFVYSCAPFRIPRPRVVQRVFGIVSTVH